MCQSKECSGWIPGWTAVIIAVAGLTTVLATGCAHSGRSVVATATAPPVSASGSTYCELVPLDKSFCEALEVDAPKAKLRLAVANTQELRERGLMGVRDVPPGEGMLFAFPDAANYPRQFWMKNTIVPLDMVFVSAQGRVTEIAENVPASKPNAPDSSIARREGTGRYVIELRAGEAEAAGIEPGTQLIVPAIVSQ